jgi:hypothetical protein
MKIDKDSIIYLILFALISLEAYMDNTYKDSMDKKINSLENICWNLSIERAKTNRRIDDAEFKIDSIQLLYLRSNK